ncbi:nucleotidyl transferase AbiEii/AbiGii toxin family protein [Shewanella baltica]|uniref:nucleotidyl transferase AbiEii/AbiGii toxin family protein n=1 Tax=Shewanella baltica TaxID=62322 RepID=UPI00217D64B9|nr:nucleotidyl transferase AbiEii/AbiGii toxin family protein [Shewanella baltica]MCS6238718.1 nucleotidyl transferase AbiEii/AbiGii toxin family protein [Shewanella baltica]
MNKSSIYYQQVTLLIRMLPLVAQEKVFALKGGTAINLFVRNFPRLSVDIDLAYLPLEPREQALQSVKEALGRLTAQINLQPNLSAVFQDNKYDELRVVVTSDRVTIKIEVSPVARGTLHKAVLMPVVELVEEEFGYAEIPVVSLPDLYGGKLCAAMDRQHPRDLFDVKMLLAEEGITREILVGFLTYTLSHPRPINEVMSPRWKPLDESFQTEFNGMTTKPIKLDELILTRSEMLTALQHHFTAKDRDFLLSFKQGQPDWSLFDEPSVAALPAVKWKLLNIQNLAKNKSKHQEQLIKLADVLETWVAGRIL